MGQYIDVQSVLIKYKYSLCCLDVLTEYCETMIDAHFQTVLQRWQSLIQVPEVLTWSVQ